MSDSRSVGGSRARAAGQAFEDLLTFLNKSYEARGLAVIYFNGTKARARKGKDGQLRFVAGPSLPDYQGALAGGRSIAFDAKTTKDPVSWRLPKKSAHQWSDLERLARMGSLTFFLIECRPRRSCYAIRVKKGEVYFGSPPRFRFDDLESGSLFDRSVVIRQDGGSYDWLGRLKSEGWL